MMLLEIQHSQRYVLEEAASLKDYSMFIALHTIDPVTIIVNDEVVGVISVYPTGIESGELVSVLSEAIRNENNKKYYVQAFREIKRYVDNLDVYRLEARVNPEVDGQARLVKFLGLEFESIMEGAGYNRSNIAMYKRLKI